MAVSIIMAVMSFRMLAAIQAHSTRNINNDVAGRHVELSFTDNRLLVRVLSRFGAVVDGKTLWQNEVAEVSEGSVILVGCHMKAVVSMVTILDPRQFE